MITDIIKIENNKIDIQMSYTIREKDNSYIGYLSSLDIPFTSPTEEKTSEIAEGLIKVLITNWINQGKIDLVREKLTKKFKYTSINDYYEFNYDPTNAVMFCNINIYY